MSSDLTAEERANQDSKFGYKAPEENRHKFQKKAWQDKAFTGVSPFDFAMQQKLREKERREKERQAKAAMYRYSGKPDMDAEAMKRKDEFSKRNVKICGFSCNDGASHKGVS